MKLKLYWNKFIFLLNKNKSLLFWLFLIALSYFTYLSSVVQFYGTKYNILVGEGLNPDPSHMPIYILLTIPTFIIYVIVTIYMTLKLNFFRCIVFPILFCSYLYALIYCSYTINSYFLWLYILGFPILFTIFCLLIIIGLIKDILTIKRLELNVRKIGKL
ncbi:TPA: hypothetical protein CPT80_06445 [Candidatus Gastranaerophilales bacterium HUM_9]|nr:MAG TPA: hypothetical protein CPT80_06445 [Candidatus Gastranaerophilales bacterium HUM_9]HBX34313.1 hypothetical protein [Cyanobacteria bacterium UBA11440]